MWSYIWTQLPSSVLGLYCTNDSCHSRVRLFGSNYKCYLQHTNAEAKPRLALNGNFKSPLLSCLVLLLLYLLILNLLSLLGSSFTLLHSSNLDFSFTVSLRCGHRWWIKWAWTGNQHWPDPCCWDSKPCGPWTTRNGPTGHQKLYGILESIHFFCHVINVHHWEQVRWS